LSLFEAIHADLTVVTDLPSFHTGYPLPEGFEITGPVFADPGAAPHGGSAALDADIVAALRRDGRPAILLTMGSSGTRELLLEAIRALVPAPRPAPGRDLAREEWNVVVLAPPAVCPLEQARAAAGESARVLVTDRFVPALAVNRLADVVVSHGGQGTVQTALAAGTPLVGVGLQMEQQINLDHVMDAGVGIASNGSAGGLRSSAARSAASWPTRGTGATPRPSRRRCGSRTVPEPPPSGCGSSC
jgi:hypothetical protein